MPSKSYIDFLELQEDVDSLRLTHFQLSNGRPGKKRLGFLTRSAVVMLCASWERYNENLLLECIDLLLQNSISISSLSNETKIFLSNKVKGDKNHIKPIDLAENGWRNLWKGYAINETESLNTPNSKNLNDLFKRHLGIPSYTRFWKSPSDITVIDRFISARGEIAHNGSKAKYIRYKQLTNYINTTKENVIEIDYNISRHLISAYNLPFTWDYTYHRELSLYK